MNQKDKGVSRRNFLKTSSLAATGSLLLGSNAFGSTFKLIFYSAPQKDSLY